jgi:hypothetical protein
MTSDYIALLLSALAFGFSAYTLWEVRFSPIKLVVYPPAVSLFNSTESSLVLDLTFFNKGRTPATVLDMEITLCNLKGDTVSSALKPQAFHQTMLPHGNFAHRRSVLSHFSPFTLKKDETAHKTIYFAPSKEKPVNLPQREAIAVNRIRLAFNINDRWNKRCFTLNLSEFKEHHQQSEGALLIRPPFAPCFFPEAEPLLLRGSIFDPVF